MNDDLRSILSRVPHKRAAARALADTRDQAEPGPWRDLFAWLAAEVAELDATERSTFTALLADCWEPRP